ncbi:MAG: 50S ribosomal protein L17 [Calditrichia bacterium]|nr:50S ribosomal protein L17 [Calditrichia bacterium]
MKGRKLGRTASHKKALLRNLANQLFEHKEIKTTTAKAKEARSYVERLITYAKKGDVHHRRLAFAFLRNKQIINTLFDEIAPVYSDRQGGYTRVVKLGRRSGDAAPISLLQLVDFEKLGESAKKKTDKKKDKTPEKKTDERISDKDKPVKAVKEEVVKEPEKKIEEVDEKVEKEELIESEVKEETKPIQEETGEQSEETEEEKDKDKKE